MMTETELEEAARRRERHASRYEGMKVGLEVNGELTCNVCWQIVRSMDASDIMDHIEGTCWEKKRQREDWM